MDLTQSLTNAACGQNNYLTQLASHVTQDRALQGTIGGTSTSELSGNNDMPPQSFRMDDLMQEMNELENQGPVRYSASSSAMNYADQWTTDYYQNQSIQSNFQKEIWYGSFSNSFYFVHLENHSSNLRQQPLHFYKNPQMTHFYGQVPTAAHFNVPFPQELYFPYQSYSGDRESKFELEQSFELENDKKCDILEEELENKQTEELQELAQDLRTAKQQHDDMTASIEEGNSLTNSEVKAAMDDMHTDIESDFDDSCWNYILDTEEEYEFIKNNPMLEISNPLQTGKAFIAKGNVTKAILCFEAALKQDKTCVEAWKLLGTTWPKDDKDRKAILPLKKGLALESHNLDIIMALAESYEKSGSNYHDVLLILLIWLKNHPKYKDIIPRDFKKNLRFSEMKNNGRIRKEITNMFIQAARRNPIEVDYQVQYALGFSCYLNSEYEKAIDCFRTALQVRPNDSRLWNRLGNTLEASNKYEEAIDAYNRALDLDPGFILYRFKLGNVCVNMADSKKALKHYLIALNHQEHEQSNIFFESNLSIRIWASLVNCLYFMGRIKLRHVTYDKDLLKKLKEEFGLTEF